MQSEHCATGQVDHRHIGLSDDPFWPRINLLELRRSLALTWHVSDARLEVAARTAADKAGGEFAQWRRVLRSRGYKRLEDLASHQRLSRCYRRAVEANARLALANDVLVVEYRPGREGEVAYE